MSKSAVFIVALAVALLSEPARQDAEPLPEKPYKPIVRVSEDRRQTIFGELHACRADVARTADAEYAEGAAPQTESMMLRRRLRYANSGNAICLQRTMRLHRLQRAELDQIEREGTCKAWPPLSGRATCG